MSVVPMPQVRPNRSQGPWDRRDVVELSQTNFRTTLRGYDRDEVRAILESVAADYRVLQLQNASLQRQLADLEAVLQAYHRGDGPDNGTALTAGHVLTRANDEARTILMDAHVKAEQTMARVVARAREAERPIEQLEQDQRNFRALLAATVSELLGVLSMTHRNPSAGNDEPKPIASTLLLEASASARAAGTELAQAASTDNSLVPVREAQGVAAPREADISNPAVSGASSLALVPVALVAREFERHDSERPNSTGGEPLLELDDPAETIELLLKSIDRALGEIPALACE